MRVLRAGSFLFGALGLGALAAAASLADQAKPGQAQPDQAKPGQAQPDQAQVERGAYLARAADCQACHTAPGGKPYAGGEAIVSPFGPIYPPNITPDKAHGIGAWSDDEFYRSLHDGVGKGGENLYPAMPYPWYTKFTREDVAAIRAFLNTVPAVDQPSKPSKLTFPFNLRTGLGAWNEAFFKSGEYKPDPSKSPQWNRGAYLVEGAGHCGDCHTPKGTAMEPIWSKPYAGGAVQNWFSNNITSDPEQGIGKWSDDELVALLKTGYTAKQGVVAGLMSQVVHDSLRYLNDDDLRAMAVYLKSIPPLKTYQRSKSGSETAAHSQGETVYLNHCSSCHQPNGQGQANAIPALDGNSLVNAEGPENVIRIVLAGHLALGPYAVMPAVGADMTDEEIGAVTDYVRNAWSNAAPVIAKRGLVSEIRNQTPTTLLGKGRIENGDPCFNGEDQPIEPIDDPQIAKALGELKAETMLPSMAPLIDRVRQIKPDMPQADIVNGLALDFCRVKQKDGGLDKPDGRRLITQFLSTVYTVVAGKARG